jgi:hypothetical protein
VEDKVYLLTTGDGSDGDEYAVVGIYKSRSDALMAKVEYDERKHFRRDGSFYQMRSNEIEEWPLL